jgi:hypothetical protein
MVNLLCNNVETVSVDDPNGIVSNNYDKDKGELLLTFNVQQSTPLGTHPLTINYSAPGASGSTKQLQLSYSVNEVITVSGPIAKDNEKMKLYTSEIEGSIELNLRDYVFDPAGLDFVIPDTCYEENYIDWLSVKIENDKLKVEYRFDEYNMGWGYNDEYKLDVSFRAINSYHYENELTFTVIYEEPTGISEEKAEKAEAKQIYNLSGQRFIKKVEELQPGVYIINGVKRIIGVR